MTIITNKLMKTADVLFSASAMSESLMMSLSLKSSDVFYCP